MIGNFLIRWRAAMLLPVAFDEVGQRALFGSECLHTVCIYTITVWAAVNEFCARLEHLVGLSLPKPLALNCIVPASQTLLFPDPRPLVERLGHDFFRLLTERPGVYCDPIYAGQGATHPSFLRPGTGRFRTTGGFNAVVRGRELDRP